MIPTVLEEWREAFRVVPVFRRQVVGFQIAFALVAGALLSPGLAWLLGHLIRSTGDYAVSTYDLVGFFLTVKGLTFLVGSASAAAALLYLELTGLLLITSDADRPVRTLAVLRQGLRRFPELGSGGNVDPLAGNVVVSAITLSGTIESLDDPVNPKRGFVLQPSLEVTAPLGFPTNEYFKAEVWGSFFRTLGNRFELSANLRVGRLFPFGKSVPSPASDGLREFLQSRDVSLGYKLNPPPLDLRDPGEVQKLLLEGQSIPEAPVRTFRRFQLHLTIGRVFGVSQAGRPLGGASAWGENGPGAPTLQGGSVDQRKPRLSSSNESSSLPVLRR